MIQRKTASQSRTMPKSCLNTRLVIQQDLMVCPGARGQASRLNRLWLGCLTLVLALALPGCEVTVPDFSNYDGVDMIPRTSTNDIGAWTADDNGNYLYFASPVNGNAVLPFSQTDSGFATAADLYAGLDAEALNADGSDPAVYRLEILNLLPDGDFNSGSLDSRWSEYSTSTGTGGLACTTGTLSRSLSNVLSVGLNNYIFLDLSLAGIQGIGTVGAVYTLHFLLNTEGGDSGIHWDSTDSQIAIDFGTNVNTWIGFPLATGSNPQITVSDTGSTTLRFSGGPLMLDNVRVARSDTGLGIRLTIPYREPSTTAPDDLTQDLRPALMNGGTYTLSFWVRNDPTAIDMANYDNRFAASAVSVGISDMSAGGTSNANPTILQANVFTEESAGAWDSWTRIDAAVTGLLTNIDLTGCAADEGLLELYIAPGNLYNVNDLCPGAILICAPRLSYSAD